MVCFSQARGSHVPRIFFFLSFLIRSLPLLIYESEKTCCNNDSLRTYFRENKQQNGAYYQKEIIGVQYSTLATTKKRLKTEGNVKRMSQNIGFGLIFDIFYKKR